MRRSIVFVSSALLLTSCAQYVWEADESRYPTKEEQERAFERYSDYCRMRSRVILSPSEQANKLPAARSGQRIVTDERLFSACMEGAGFRRVIRNAERTASTPPKKSEQAGEKSDSNTVTAVPQAAQVPASRQPKTTEPEPGGATTAPASPTSSTAVPPPAPSAKVAGGPYRIQLAALTTRAKAEKERTRLQSNLTEILRAKELIIAEGEIPGRGTVYRIQTGGFDTLSEAQAMCRKLRVKEQACFTLKKS
jgi:cell division septation protein DedD